MKKRPLSTVALIPVLLFSLITLFYSCEKPEGYGGSSAIKGVLQNVYYNDDFSDIVKEGPAVDEEIFLLFGENDDLGDRTFTSLTGNFKFDFLQPGKYTLYYMSEDSTIQDGEERVLSMQLDLKSGQTMDLDTLFRNVTLDFDDGAASIKGVVRLVNYTNESVFPFMEVKDTSFAQDHEVFIIYGDHEFYDDRIRTSYNGVFEFDDLIPGDYMIFTLSEDISGGTEDVVVSREVTITGETEEIDLGVLLIEQL